MLLVWLGPFMAAKRRAASKAAVQQLEITAKTLEMQLAQGIGPMWPLLPSGVPGLISLLLLHLCFLRRSRTAAPQVRVTLGA